MLDKNALFDLDEIIEEEWRRLCEIREQEIAEASKITLQKKLGSVK